MMYSTRQAANILGYADDAVIRVMIAKGKIKAKKIDRFWVISEREITRLKFKRGML